ncbi:uncharacterized protein VTP21DRAFT_482 [Calcarisporiella thermophila]|uniref:uncharacterized protein n=1 Tax=Calcarisporiella thermophila TaxID=911321 RepID=UPI003742AC38
MPSSTRTENVFLFIPNLIGYTRIILAAIALYYMPTNTAICVIAYSISALLDAVDGYAARYFNQCSRFGSVLDMVTDRSTTTCLLCYLCMIYPIQYAILFQALIALDLSSHYTHMYSTLTSGASSHKIISDKWHPFLRAYYSNNIVLFLMCAGNELFFIMLYTMGQKDNGQNHSGPLLMEIGNQPIHLWPLLAVITFPVCFLKQVINWIQFVNASKTLARIDMEERKGSKKK